MYVGEEVFVEVNMWSQTQHPFCQNEVDGKSGEAAAKLLVRNAQTPLHVSTHSESQVFKAIIGLMLG